MLVSHRSPDDRFVTPRQSARTVERGDSRLSGDSFASPREVEDIFSLARHNRVDEVDRLLLRGVPPHVTDEFGNTILIIACQNGHKRVAKAALRRGADINAGNARGNTGLHFCFAYGYGDTLGSYLISKGADPTVLNYSGLNCYEGLAR